MLASGPKWLKLRLPLASAFVIAWRISARLKRWKLSPSTTAGLICARRKICSKATLTVEVPAPLEPVMEMIGYFLDIAEFLQATESGTFYLRDRYFRY